MQLNIAPLVPQLLAALRPGANLKDLAKSMGLEIQSIEVGTEADYLARMSIAKAIRAAGSDVVFIHGEPAMLNGKKIQILAVMGDFSAQLDAT